MATILTVLYANPGEPHAEPHHEVHFIEENP